MITTLARFERTACNCRQCLGPCTSGKPGALAPGEVDHIAEHIGLDEASESFLVKMFTAASDGPGAPTEEFPSGETPAIRPRVRDDGRCVFLGDEGQCTIHPVAPFECSRINQCDPAEGAAALRQLGVAITKSADYVQLWWWLYKQENPDLYPNNQTP